MSETVMSRQGFSSMGFAAPCLAQALPMPLPAMPFPAPYMMSPFAPMPDLSLWMMSLGMGLAPALCALPPPVPLLPAPTHLTLDATPLLSKPRSAGKKLVAPTRPRRGRLGRSTFANMIEDALKAADERWVSLAYIYKYFASHLQHVIAAHPKWQDCVRRTLCINRNRFIHQPHQLGMTHGGMWGLCDTDDISSSKSASDRRSGCSTPSHVSKAVPAPAVMTSSASTASEVSADVTPADVESKTDMAAILLSLNQSPGRGAIHRDECAE